MDPSVKSLTRASVSAAAGFVLLYLSSVIPWGRLAILCAATIGVVFVRMSCSCAWALGCYAVTAALGILLLPVKSPSLLYGLFLGYYPLIRIRAERIGNKTLRILLKLAVFNLAAFMIYMLYSRLFYDIAGNASLPLYLLWIAANGVFLIYDYALGQMILYYLRNLAGRFK
jgi:hypothetical protein